jgi:lipid-binding SYLF domain-containing protein
MGTEFNSVPKLNTLTEVFIMKRDNQKSVRRVFIASSVMFVLFLFTAVLLAPNISQAKSAKEIDIQVDVALEKFEKDVKGGKEFLKSSKGVLVFPSVIKAGLVVGGEYGEGAMRINGKTVNYYSTAAASFGFQLGAQSKTVILVFMEDKALKGFRDSSGWEAGVDGSVALIELGAGGSIDSTNIKDPIVGFVFGNKGLMYNLTLEGSKFTKLVR